MGEESSQKTEGGFVKFTETPDSWQTRVQERLVLPFPLPWLLISLVLFGLCYSIPYSNGEGKPLLRLFAMECFIVAALTNSVVFFEKLMDDAADNYPLLLDENEVTANRWIEKWYDRMFWSRKNLVVGLFFAVGIPAVYASCGPVDFDKTSVWVSSLVLMTVLGFVAGSYFWVILCIARMFKSMGRDVKIKPSIFDGKTSVLRGASAILFKVSVVSALIYISGVSTSYFCGIHYDDLSMGVTYGFGIFILIYFIVPQWNIHKSLLEIKRARLNALVEQIDNTFDLVASDASREAIQRLHDLLDLQGVVNGKRSWSFGTKDLLTLISTILFPLAMFFLKYHWDKSPK